MKTFITEIKAINPKSGQMARWYGPEIIAKNYKDAEKYISKNQMGYCHIVGIWKKERKYNDGTTGTLILEREEEYKEINRDKLIEDIYSNLPDSHN